MQKFYLVPAEEVVSDSGRLYRGPEYFFWRMDTTPETSIYCSRKIMDYGPAPSMLVLALDITQEQHDSLVLHTDVFAFPDALDGPVDQDIQVFFEGIHLPTDWLTPSTTWLELLRQVAGMLQFNQRYGEISEGHSIFETATLDTRLRQMTAEEQAWFMATVDSFGFDSSLVSTNSRLRQLVKTAGSYWDGEPFFMGGVEF